MSTQKKYLKAIFALALMVSSVGIGKPAGAERVQVGFKRTLTATIKGGKNLTVILVSGTGRTLASKVITKSSQNVSLSVPAVSKITGLNLQLISSTGSSRGEYFGPVVLGWKGSKFSKASTVYMRLKNSSSKKIALGTLTVKSIGAAKKQGYAVASKQVAAVSRTDSMSARASNGRPLGVGTYGKSGSVSTQSVSSMAAPAIDPPIQNQLSEGPVEADENTFGGDKDKDGLPNAFDVDDDGDGTLDAADASTPTPQVSADDGSKDCGAIRWNIFTNFKATGENFAGTINAHGTGAFEATPTAIATTIQNTMTMVFQPISQVCGSPVTATYIKGNGVPYAPSTYTRVASPCSTGDFQWLIGKGRMCSTDGSGYGFGNAYSFSPTDLPSGQDTFSIKLETVSGKSYEFTASPGFVFVTHPMLKSYNTGAGEQKVVYGAAIPRIPINSGTELILTFYRPQRLGFDGESGQFYDLGGFKYTPDIPNGVNNGPDRPGKCDSGSQIDTSLVNDTAVDKAAPSTVTLKWKIGQCFSLRGISWSAGTLNVDMQVEPAGPGGNSAQKIFLTLL